MNNSNVEKHHNYEKYQRFVEHNFAIKSIAYGLLNENIINNNVNLSDELSKLNDLHEKGVLTQEEFEQAKNKLLNQ